MTSKPIQWITLAGVGAVFLFAAPKIASSQNPDAKIQLIELGKLQLKDNPLLPGVGNTFVLGAFDKPGVYAAHSRMAKGSRFPPHTHPDVRLTVVTSGVMYLGEGDVFDEVRLVAYPVGTVAVTPAGTPHYMYAKEGDVTVMEIGAGPSGAAFVKK
jgi:quercetin dioxygenase-like cupin family protein